MAKKNSESTTTKLPKNLQLGDKVYTICKGQMVEGENNPDGTQYFYIDVTEVTDLSFDKNDKSKIVINNKVAIEANGSLEPPTLGKIIIDENAAIQAVIKFITEEKNKLERKIEQLNKELKGVENNLAVYTSKNSLNDPKKIVIEITENSENDE